MRLNWLGLGVQKMLLSDQILIKFFDMNLKPEIYFLRWKWLKWCWFQLICSKSIERALILIENGQNPLKLVETNQKVLIQLTFLNKFWPILMEFEHLIVIFNQKLVKIIKFYSKAYKFNRKWVEIHWQSVSTFSPILMSDFESDVFRLSNLDGLESELSTIGF